MILYMNCLFQTVKCRHPDGTLFSEGTNIELRGDDVPRSADVVFVVEEGECNKEVSWLSSKTAKYL